MWCLVFFFYGGRLFFNGCGFYMYGFDVFYGFYGFYGYRSDLCCGGVFGFVGGKLDVRFV